MKWLLNFYPPYFFTRTKVKSISSDWREIVVELPKSILTRNYVGTTFGGSLYASADPFLMIMLIKILGIQNYIVWDKSAEIDFKKPARSKITYHFRITDDDLERIQKEISERGKIVSFFTVNGIDREGQICVVIKKGIYIRKK
ncbi:MAG: YiiD C-terminal domain-containing protein [Deltaproteobacteria bacterium]|nr:YiiD C-terminal domain-containing protein [Deltaproteobacteria bacterium]